MRWKFAEPSHHAENAQRIEIIRQIDAWWRQFELKSAEIAAVFSKKSDLDLPEWMSQHLQPINQDLMWEFGPAVHQTGHRLVITPESRHDLRPLVQTILQRAPAIDGWEFYEYRLAEDLSSTVAAVLGRTGIELNDFQFRASIGTHNRIDLVFTSPNISDEAAGYRAAFVATETLLGERCLDNWIRAIEFVLQPRKTKLKSVVSSLFGRTSSGALNFQPLERLNDVVQSLIGAIQDQLPPSPHYAWITDAGCTMWELNPVEAEDYHGQLDLFVARSQSQKMWTAAHSGQFFASERFSRCGETFCYIKFDSSEGFGRENLEKRHRIEEVLNSVLKRNKSGCCVGGGTGLKYWYIDLALTDFVESVQTIKRQLRDEQIPHQSWILFFDDDLAAEWVGIFEDTSPPPRLLNSTSDED